MRDGYSHSDAGRLGAFAVRDRIKAAKENRVACYNQNPTTCQQCGAPLPYEKRANRFCSHSCAASHNNVDVCRNGQSMSSTNKRCLYCGELIPKNKTYCDIECNLAYRNAASDQEVETQPETLPHRRFKRFLLRTRERRCEICKQTQWLGQEIPLEMDHINGDATDNSLTNLRLLCPNCHALTPTYKGKNYGNGRNKRRERYHQGKSY